MISKRLRVDDAVQSTLQHPVRSYYRSSDEAKERAVASIDDVWPRIRALAGQEFTQKGGKPFTYRAGDNYVDLATTNRNISRTAFARALDRVPLDGPSAVNDLSAPSYIYGILMDERVRRSDW